MQAQGGVAVSQAQVHKTDNGDGKKDEVRMGFGLINWQLILPPRFCLCVRLQCANTLELTSRAYYSRSNFVFKEDLGCSLESYSLNAACS